MHALFVHSLSYTNTNTYAHTYVYFKKKKVRNTFHYVFSFQFAFFFFFWTFIRLLFTYHHYYNFFLFWPEITKKKVKKEEKKSGWKFNLEKIRKEKKISYIVWKLTRTQKVFSYFILFFLLLSFSLCFLFTGKKKKEWNKERGSTKSK